MKKYDKDKQKIKFVLSNLFVGGLAGAYALFWVYPMEFARTRMGVDIGKTIDEREFKNLRHCISKIYNTDGIRGVYRGFVASVVYAFVQRGFYFGLYDTSKAYLLTDGLRSNLFTMWLLAQSTTIVAGIISYPLDTIRRRLMMQSGRSDVIYKNSYD